MKIEILEEDSLLDEKLDMLGRENTLQPFRLLKLFEDKTLEELLATVRFVLAGEEELETLNDYFKETGGGVRVTATPYITYELESKTWTHFKNILEEQLKEYPTTLLQDRKILEEPNSLSVNVTNCILLRKGEKEILHYFLKIAQRMSRIFSMSRLDFIKAAKRQEYKEYRQYLNKVLTELTEA